MLEIKTSDYHYDLRSERIAQYPLSQRDQSKLLVYKQGKISHSIFAHLDTELTEDSCLFFNNTRVIPARLHFKKDTGAEIEIFILNPVLPSALVFEAMQSVNTSTWKCAIGNLKRWGDDLILKHKTGNCELEAQLVSREEGIVRFSWSPSNLTFAEIIKESGSTPLPPYLKRNAEKEDKERYQTVYSQADGAVAAPTAGLHFTTEVLDKITKKNIGVEFLTLHVSAGTFLPIKSDNALDHQMHSEQVVINKKTIENLLKTDQRVIAVGTTSMRTLESLYWYGVKLLTDKTQEFLIHKMDPYELTANISSHVSLLAIYAKMQTEQLEVLIGETSIYIVPGYQFRICKGLVTNFHQPSSTLMLLIAAFIGEDWKKVYQAALENDYRFLSYGDSSFLLP